MNTTPKAYSYIRFSTPEQEKGDSLRRQEKRAEEYCLKNNVEYRNKLGYAVSDYTKDCKSFPEAISHLQAIDC